MGCDPLFRISKKLIDVFEKLIYKKLSEPSPCKGISAGILSQISSNNRLTGSFMAIIHGLHWFVPITGLRGRS